MILLCCWPCNHLASAGSSYRRARSISVACWGGPRTRSGEGEGGGGGGGGRGGGGGGTGEIYVEVYGPTGKTASSKNVVLRGNFLQI